MLYYLLLSLLVTVNHMRRVVGEREPITYLLVLVTFMTQFCTQARLIYTRNNTVSSLTFCCMMLYALNAGLCNNNAGQFANKPT